MTTLSGRRFSLQPLFAAAVAAPTLVVAGEAWAHETGTPHGAMEHLALYGGAAALLGLAGLFIARSTRDRAERRVRVEKDDPRRRLPRR